MIKKKSKEDYAICNKQINKNVKSFFLVGNKNVKLRDCFDKNIFCFTNFIIKIPKKINSFLKIIVYMYRQLYVYTIFCIQFYKTKNKVIKGRPFCIQLYVYTIFCRCCRPTAGYVAEIMEEQCSFQNTYLCLACVDLLVICFFFFGTLKGRPE